jgi:hypothetical protein
VPHPAEFRHISIPTPFSEGFSLISNPPDFDHRPNRASEIFRPAAANTWAPRFRNALDSHGELVVQQLSYGTIALPKERLRLGRSCLIPRHVRRTRRITTVTEQRTTDRPFERQS